MIITEQKLFENIYKREKYFLKKYKKSLTATTVLNIVSKDIILNSEIMNSKQGPVFTLCNNWSKIITKEFKNYYL